MGFKGGIMSWRMIGKPLLTADMSGIPTITQKFNSAALTNDYLLKSIGLGIILYNDPVFTNVYAEIWSDRSGAAQKLIATSNSIPKSECLLTDLHGFKMIGFSFDSAIPMRSQTAYHVALRASGYTGTNASHLALRISYPDQQYTSATPDAVNGAKHHFDMSIISADM
jgi:hypothetical protein